MRRAFLGALRILAAVFIVNLTMQATAINLVLPAGSSKTAVMAPAASASAALVQRVRGHRRLSSPQAVGIGAVSLAPQPPAASEPAADAFALSRGRAAPDHPPA